MSDERGERPASDEAARLRARAAEIERLRRLEAEQALRESEARYRELVDQCPDPIVVHRDGIILFANEAAARMAASDLAPVDLVGRHVLDFVHPAEQPLAREQLAEVSAGATPLPSIENRVLTPGGRELRLESVERVIHWEGKRAVQVVVRDVTERRRAEEDLRRMQLELEQRVAERTRDLGESEARWRALLGASPDTLIRLRVDGTLLDIHPGPGFEEHYRPRRRIGHQVWDRVPPGEEARVRELLARVCRTGRMERVEFHSEASGTVRHFETRLVASGPDEVLAVVRDISEATRTREELRAAEERLRLADRLASIGTLAAGIAHEINNPVGSILVAAQYALGAAQGGGLDPATRRSLLDIADHARRCGRIVHDVLQFAREERLEKRAVDLNVCVEAVRDLAREIARAGGVGIDFELCGQALPVRASPTALGQVLLNVIRNAVEASRAGQLIQVSTNSGVGTAVVLVRDAGRGMTAEEKTCLFDPFYTTRRAEGGTGLGLSISHGIVADHGGAIRVESEPGRGTSVAIEIPSAGG